MMTTLYVKIQLIVMAYLATGKTHLYTGQSEVKAIREKVKREADKIAADGCSLKETRKRMNLIYRRFDQKGFYGKHYRSAVNAEMEARGWGVESRDDTKGMPTLFD